MATRARRSGPEWSTLTSKFRDSLFSSKVFPLVLAFTLLAVLFVLFRMKGVEMDYLTTEVDGMIRQQTLENKELKAKKARMLSASNLRRLAEEHALKRPDQKQIIVVP